MELHEMWTEQCDATNGIRTAFGVQQALNYLIGEKFLDFVETSENNGLFRNELLSFAARIRTLFEPQELAAYLAPVDDSSLVRDPAIVRCASDQNLVNKAWSHIQNES